MVDDFHKIECFYKLLIFNKIHLSFLMRPSFLLAIKNPTDCTASTTRGQPNGQTSTTREETDTTRGQTSSMSGQANGQMNTTFG